MQNVLNSPDGQVLLNAILQNPDDDAPRLLLAGWLEGHGDPDRAAFIRLQCEAVRLFDCPERQERMAAADALLERHRAEWLADLGPELTRPAFYRGFVAAADMTVEDFILHAGRLLDRTPLERVRVQVPTSADIRRLGASELLGRVPRLDLSFNRLGDRGAMILAESPHLKHLREIGLGFNEIGRAGALAVLNSLAGGRTTAVDLSMNRLGSRGAAAVADCPTVAGLTELRLLFAGIGVAGAEALAASPRLGGLVEFEVGGNPLGDDGVIALAGSAALRPEVLALDDTRLGDRGVAVLARSPVLRRVTDLLLGNNRIGERGAVALSRSRWLGRLRDLGLCGNRVTDRGFVSLVNGLPGLQELDLIGNGLSEEVVTRHFPYPLAAGVLRGRSAWKE